MGISTVSRASETAGGLLSLVLGSLLMIAAALGPLVAGRVRLHMSSDAQVQYLGGEIVTIAVSVILVVSAFGWWAGWHWVPAMASGVSAYVAYTFATLVAGQEYGRYPGNVEKAFLLYAAISAAAVALLVVAFRVLVSNGIKRVPRHATGCVLITIAVLIALVWVGQLAGYYRTGPTHEYETARSLFWLIKYLDLGIVIPLAVLTGVLQWSPSPGSDAAAVTMLGLLSCLLLAICLMGLEMLHRGTPGASWALAIGALVLLLPPAALWVRCLVRGT